MEVPKPEKIECEVEVAVAGAALLVDDEELVRASTADMLADLGYSVVKTKSAEEELRLAEDGLTPDVVKRSKISLSPHMSKRPTLGS